MTGGGTRRDVSAYETTTSPDFIEVTVGATDEVDLSAIGGYPVRRVIVVTGTGTLSYQTPLGGTLLNKVATLAPGEELGPAQITSIRGTTDTTVDAGGSPAPTSGVTKIRVYK